MVKFSLHFENLAPQAACDSLLNAIVQERESQKSGYYHLPFEDKACKEASAYISSHKDKLDSITHLVIVGIGGSSLGLKAIDSMLSHLPCRKSIKLVFLEHTDPICVVQSLQDVQLERALFIVISKSGTTIETSSLLKFILHKYEILKNPHNKAHLLIITDAQSPLEQWARTESIHYINIASNVGGRFSVLSAVGIVPLAILGFDVEAILRGAASIMHRFFEQKEAHILHKAITYAKHYEQIPMNVLFSYSSIFTHFNAWYVQLWGESLGKINAQGKRVGLSPIGLIGSIDQHSFLQLIVQGMQDKSVTFLSLNPACNPKPIIPDMQLAFLETTNFVNGISFATLLDNQRIATMQTLEHEGILVDCIEVERLCEESVGTLIAYYELLTSCVGALFDVNTYDQPGVEFGKKRLRGLFK